MAKVMFMQSIWYPLEGVMCLSAALKQEGHRTAVSVGDRDKVLREVEGFGPDIIGIPTLTTSRKFMIDVSKALRETGYGGIIIAGGVDASFFPEIIQLAPLDAVCVGEGDEALVELADAVDKGEDHSKIKNLWVRKGKKIIKNPLRPFNDVNQRPFSDRDIYRHGIRADYCWEGLPPQLQFLLSSCLQTDVWAPWPELFRSAGAAEGC